MKILLLIFGLIVSSYGQYSPEQPQNQAQRTTVRFSQSIYEFRVFSNDSIESPSSSILVGKLELIRVLSNDQDSSSSSSSSSVIPWTETASLVEGDELQVVLNSSIGLTAARVDARTYEMRIDSSSSIFKNNQHRSAKTTRKFHMRAFLTRRSYRPGHSILDACLVIMRVIDDSTSSDQRPLKFRLNPYEVNL